MGELITTEITPTQEIGKPAPIRGPFFFIFDKVGFWGGEKNHENSYKQCYLLVNLNI